MASGLAVWAGCAPASSPAPASTPAPAAEARPARGIEALAPPAPDGVVRVEVFYGAGGCETRTIEIQVYDRARRRWTPHPRHPRIPADVCRWEEPGRLLNELRVRCVDPGGVRPPSTWVVGVARRAAAAPRPCDPR